MYQKVFYDNGLSHDSCTLAWYVQLLTTLRSVCMMCLTGYKEQQISYVSKCT